MSQERASLKVDIGIQCSDVICIQSSGVNLKCAICESHMVDREPAEVDKEDVDVPVQTSNGHLSWYDWKNLSLTSLDNYTPISTPDSDQPFSSAFLSGSQPSSQPSAVTFNLKGPLSEGEPINHLSLTIPSTVRSVYDIGFHSPLSIICCYNNGLFFLPEEGAVPVHVCDKKSWSVCINSKGTAAYVTGGWKDPCVRKYDLRMGTPRELRGAGFRVEGGESLLGISCSALGLLAVCDYDTQRLTVHDKSGEVVSEVADLFEGRPVSVSWLSLGRVCMKVKEEERWWIVCADVSSGQRLWQSRDVADMWDLSCCASRVFVAIFGSATFLVLCGDSGEVLEDRVVGKGDFAVKVFERDHDLTAVSWKRPKPGDLGGHGHQEGR